MSKPEALSQITAAVHQGVRQPAGFPGLPEGWSTEFEFFPSSDGQVNLFAATHKKKTGHRALVILHGFGEHGGRYLHVPHFVQKDIDVVYCFDHRGHGRSEGQRGHVDRFDLFAEDALLAIKRLDAKLKKEFGKSEIHVLGHSMGSLILFRSAFLHASALSKIPVLSMTASAPFLAVKVAVSPVKKLAAYALANVWGNLSISSPFDPALLSHDKNVCNAYASDRLVHAIMTPKMYTQVQWAMSDTMKRHTGVKQPLQVLIPLSDGVVDEDLSVKFYEELKLKDKLMKTYPGFFHEPMNEVGKEQVFADICSWFQKWSPPGKTL